MPEIFGRIRSTVGEIFSPRTAGQKIQLNVCMMGPRGVGKTTILTSIFKDSSKILSDSNLYFSPVGTTYDLLKEGQNQLVEIFSSYKGEKSTPLPGINATTEVTDFDFNMGLCNTGNKKNKSSVDVHITDFPGEFVEKDHPEHDKVIEMIKNSCVIMIAVDSVYLMEEEGIYNELKNKSKYICDKFIEIFSQLDPKSRKLIMFVPLKCERYVVDQRINEVSSAIVKAYKPLIDEMQKDVYRNRVGMFVTPIQTLGGVVFDKFESTDDDEIIMEDGIPQKANFRFYRVIPTMEPKYLPVYCVQPLYYVLKFALSEYKNEKNNGGIISTFFKGLCSLFSSDLKFYEACQEATKNLKSEGNGYLKLQNPGLI